LRNSDPPAGPHPELDDVRIWVVLAEVQGLVGDRQRTYASE